MKIAYLGIDMLQSVLHAVLREGHEVMHVFTCKTDNVTEFSLDVRNTAQRHGIPCTDERVTRADLDALARAGCELLLCAGYYHRVPITEAFPMVNVHPAPLPECRGAWPMPLILLGAHPVGGVTFHRMAREFDTGDILLESAFPIGEGDTLQDYMAHVDECVPGMVHTLLSDLPACLAKARPQGPGRYLPNPGEDAWTLSDTMTAREADRILRAFWGYECLYRHGGRVYEFIGARAVEGPAEGPYPLADGQIRPQKVRVLTCEA